MLLQLLCAVSCLLVASVSGQAWHTDENISGVNTHGAPAAITIGSTLYVFYEYSSGGQVNYASVSLSTAYSGGGDGWSVNHELFTMNGGDLGISGLGPTAWYDGSVWYVAHVGEGSSTAVYVTRGTGLPGDEAHTYADTQIANANSAGYPLIAACSGTVLLAWEGQSDDLLHFSTSTDQASSWTPQAVVSTPGGGVVYITGGASAVCSNGVLYIFHTGTGSSSTQAFMTSYTVATGVWGVDGIISGITGVQHTPGILPYYTASGAMQYILTWQYSNSLQYATNSQLSVTGWSSTGTAPNTGTTSGCVGAIYLDSSNKNATLCVHWASNNGNALYIQAFYNV